MAEEMILKCCDLLLVRSRGAFRVPGRGRNHRYAAVFLYSRQG